MNINLITPAPWNTRTAITDESVRALAESIKAGGLIQPLGVVADPEHKSRFICYDGNRRLAACLMLGIAEVPVTVADITIEDAKVRTVTANLQREDDDPLLAAKVIAELDADAETIASKLGKTVTWVRRRAKLNALVESVRAYAGEVTLELLERVSDLNEAQQTAIAKSLANRVKWANGALVKWNDIRREVEGMTQDLDDALFDCAECLGCTSRTGADWFAEQGDWLGRCLDGKCYKRKLREWKAAKIAEVIPADAEREEIEYEWQMPNEARNDAKNKRDKKHPCAYYWFDSDGVTVKWAKSKAALEAERDERKAAEEAEREAARADREREERIRSSVGEWLESEDGEVVIRRRLNQLLANAEPAEREYMVDGIYNALSSWHDCEETAQMLRAFSWLAVGASISDDDAAWFVERNAPDADEDADND